MRQYCKHDLDQTTSTSRLSSHRVKVEDIPSTQNHTAKTDGAEWIFFCRQERLQHRTLCLCLCLIGPVIPRATNRKQPSGRMNLRAVSRGCCGGIRWCWLAYLSGKAASAVQKRGGWCHTSLQRDSDKYEHSREAHREALSALYSAFPALQAMFSSSYFSCIYEIRFSSTFLNKLILSAASNKLML